MDLIPQLLVDALLLGGIYTLMAIGLALSFGVTRVVNFAHASLLLAGGYVTADVRIEVPVLFPGTVSFPFTVHGHAGAVEEEDD